MKHSAGFTRLWPTIISLVGMVASMVLLSISMKTLPLGTAYSVWTGIGAVGAFIFGIVALGEQAGAGRILAAVLIVSGLVLMKLSDNSG
jgi:quaternary ammonium compound-resistance protein SugE